MNLAQAALGYLIANYVKIYALLAPICSVWKYYQYSSPINTLVLELILVLVLALITLGSLSLSRMECNRIANYLTLPVLMGLAYFDAAHYHRSNEARAVPNETRHKEEEEEEQAHVGPLESANTHSAAHFSIVNSIELTLVNGLACLLALQVLANLFHLRLTKLFS